MKIFSKMTAFLIIASFIFSGDTFARYGDEAERGNRSIRTRPTANHGKPAVHKTTARRSATKNLGRPELAKRATASKARKSAAPRRKAAERKITVKPTSKRTQQNVKPTPVAPVKTTKAVRPANTNIQNKIPAPARNIRNAPAKAKDPVAPKPTRIVRQNVKPTPVTPVKTTKVGRPASTNVHNKRPAPARNVRKARVKGKKNSSPVNKKNAALKKPQPHARPVPRVEPQTYLIHLKDMPKNLRNDLKLCFEEDDEEDDDDDEARVTPAGLRMLLAYLKEVENYASGITQRTRRYLKTRGYNPATNNHVVIDRSAPEDLKFYLDSVEDVDFDDSPSLILSSPEITKGLNKMQKYEKAAKNITARLRKHLARYGFKG